MLLEGWRVQLVPLYLLAVLMPLLRGLARHVNLWRGYLRVIGSGVSVLVFVLAGLLAGWLLPVPSLPTPTGPYPVGVVDREVFDTSRGRRLMTSVWYPAARSGGPAPLTHYPREIATGLTTAFGVPAAPLLQQLRYAQVSAGQGVPVNTDHGAFPVLVFSHGLVGLRLQNSSSFQELASRGYVVVALDHTDAAAVTVFPGGETRLFNLQRLGIRPADIERSTDLLLPVWVADQRFIYDTLTEWATDDPLLAGRLDLTRMGSFGHSFGGVTALEVCRKESRCRAAVNLDGGLPKGWEHTPMTRPSLLMSASSSNRLPTALRTWTQLVEEADAPAYWLELPGSNHYSFTILPLISPLLAPLATDARTNLHIIDKYLRTFFDTYLEGKAPLLPESIPENTDVLWRATTHSR